MKPLLLGLAIALFAFCFYTSVHAQTGIDNFGPPPPGQPFPLIQNGTKLVKTNRTVPPFFTNTATKFNFTTSPSQCKAFCVRQSVKTWTTRHWALYGQLWNEINKRGYWGDIQKMHAQDCNPNYDNICAFHFCKDFWPWHRFYISHLEQVFQNVDHEINPGRAYREGEFCLGYWDYGYQQPFSNNLEDSVYSYVFNAQAMGTLQGPAVPFNTTPTTYYNITDGYYKYLRVPLYGDQFNWTLRAVSLGNQSWNNAAIANCVSLADVEANGNATLGARPCVELGVHGAIHTAVGGIMGNLQWSPGDPIFFLHHTMVDYMWWIWQQNSGSFYPTNPEWQDQMSQPYDQWTQNDAKDYRRFCFNYQPEGTVGQSANFTGSGAPGSYHQLGQGYKNILKKLYQEGPPSLLGKSAWAQFISSHISGPELVDQLYASYEGSIKNAQAQYNNLTSYYYASYTNATGSTSTKSNWATTPSGSLISSTPTAGAPKGATVNKGTVTNFLNAAAGCKS